MGDLAIGLNVQRGAVCLSVVVPGDTAGVVRLDLLARGVSDEIHTALRAAASAALSEVAAYRRRPPAAFGPAW